MKIEKINDSQIRCTLTSDDLASRKIKLSELAYGTEKAKNLFQDMMQQAHYEFGFESDNSPLMIEAIPVAPDSIVLIITKLAAHGLNHFYSGRNSLYKNETLGSYQLVLHQSDCTPEAFNKVCNILSEYGTNETFSASGEAYLLEHGNALIRDTALQNLADI